MKQKKAKKTKTKIKTTTNSYRKQIWQCFFFFLSSSKTSKSNLRSQNTFNDIFFSVIKFDLQIVTTFCHVNTVSGLVTKFIKCAVLCLDWIEKKLQETIHRNTESSTKNVSIFNLFSVKIFGRICRSIHVSFQIFSRNA